MFRPIWHHMICVIILTSGSNLITDKCFYFHLLLKGNRFILQRAINEREEHAPDTCDECVMKEWRHWGGWPLWGWRSGPMIVKGDGKKWDSLYEISLGNPSDARPHYDCGHSIKARLLLSFLFLLAALKQKIWAVTSSPAPQPPHLCAEGALLTQGSKVILWPAFPGQNYGQSLPSCEDESVCVLSVCTYACVHTPTHAHTYPMRLSIQCWEPAAAKPPIYWQQPNGGSYFWASLSQNGNTVITAVSTDEHRPHYLHNTTFKLGSLVASACRRFRDLLDFEGTQVLKFL